MAFVGTNSIRINFETALKRVPQWHFHLPGVQLWDADLRKKTNSKCQIIFDSSEELNFKVDLLIR